jgi:hypothetical protein
MKPAERLDAGPGEVQADQVPVIRRGQLTNMWCWAACGEMIMGVLGVNVTQCDEANRRFRRSDCCLSPAPGECVQGGWPQFDEYGFSFAKTSYSPLTWEQVVDQISARRTPFAFTWAWDGGGGHMMVLYGYTVVHGVRYVLVHDPWPPNEGASRAITYDAYVQGLGYYHWDDYYNVALARFGPSGDTEPGSMEELVPGQREAINGSRREAADALGVARVLAEATAGPGAGNEAMALGAPITISTVRLDELKTAIPPAAGDSGSPALGLLKRRPAQVVYPIVVGAAATGEITLVQHGTAWKSTGTGSPALVRRVLRVASSPGAPPASGSGAPLAVVSVPALNQQFVIERAEDGERYIPIIDDPAVGFIAGQRLTAHEALASLIRAAKLHDNTPR